MLLWICGSAIRYEKYVANRVGEDKFKRQTSLNMADFAKRFISKIGFTSGFQWFTGPDFFHAEPSLFPKNEIS